MSLPLPLELTAPVLLVDDLNTQVRGQMCSHTTSCQKSKTYNAAGLVQVDLADVQVDDVLA